MKRLIIQSFLTFILLSCNPHIENNNHKEFIKKQDLTAKDYIINLFETNDIVILCERFHAEFTQYELFLEIAKDSYFINNVGHIYTEVGVFNMNNAINTFLQSKDVDSISDRKNISNIFRNIDNTPYWHCNNYPWFLWELFKLNQSLPTDKKIRLHPVDESFNWSDYQTVLDYKKHLSNQLNRDSLMANNFMQTYQKQSKYNSGRKKALVIMNYRHEFFKDYEFIDYKKGSRQNFGKFILEKFVDKVSNVYIMGLGMPIMNKYTVVQDGKWDAIFEQSNKTNVGFNIKGTPFGKDDFDVIPREIIKEKFIYEEVFTDLVYYNPIQEHKLVYGWNGFVTNNFEPEAIRRARIFFEAIGNDMTEEELKKWVWGLNNEDWEYYEDIDSLRLLIDNKKNGL
ncbi:hypothetical protein [Winogradskyella endarachnes]|uniref:Uncharacterized protein n=1 Tax=Winogradskyella endarachnes TaxID=2681965 RepID=A0A6L6U925_9FLAO|nr:hypothetical protein [Winogradskyella endarachnes]MUU78688.1 hypothetical protein [Winogradskyella endarachnes]